MLIRIQKCFVRKTITPEVLACTGVDLRRHGSTLVPPREPRRNGYQSLPRQHVPSVPPVSAHPGTLPQQRQCPPPPEDAPSTTRASPPGRTRARPHQPTPESAHRSLYTRRGRARVVVRGPALSHPESVRLPTPTSAVGPRHRTRSACRQSSARPSPWPPSASGSTNGRRP